MTTHGTDPESRIEQMLREAAWVEPMAPVDLGAVSRRASARHRWQIAIASGSAAVIVSAAAVAVVAVADGDQRGLNPPAASGDGVVPWVDRPATGSEPGVTTKCDSAGIDVATGKAGAWHGMTTQQIVLTNTTATPCVLAGAITVDVTTDSGATSSVDMSAVRDSAVELAGRQSAQLMVGTLASCSDGDVSIARDLTVTLAGGEAANLGDAWLAVGCSEPQAISLLADPVEPATQHFNLSAAIRDVGPAVAGGPLHFVVALTNNGSDQITFADCPSYLMGLKEAGLSLAYELNCSEVNVIPAGGSATYAMELAVPDAARGAEVLTWSLDGYAAAVSIEIMVG